MPRQPKPWLWASRQAYYAQIHGKQVRLCSQAEGRAEAQKELYRRLAEQGVAPPPRRITTRELFNEFLDDVERQVERGERARSTYDGYRRFLKSAATVLGPRRPEELRPIDVQRWCEAPALNWNPTTRFNAITVVKAAFAWAKRVGLIRENPIADMARPTPKRREAVPTDDQVRVLLAEASDQAFRDLVTALWETGCRPNEVITLEADRVDLDAGTWRVLNKTRGKTGVHYRVVPINRTVADLSRRLCAAWPTGPIFRNRDGNPWTRHAIAWRFKRLRDKLGLDRGATSYGLRHLFGVMSLRAGNTSSETAAIMGHRDARMVDQVYGHWQDQDELVRRAAERVRPGKQDAQER